MAESSNLRVEAREIMATPSHEGIEIIVQQLSFHKETYEFQTGSALWDFCVGYFRNLLTLKLLKVYQSSSSDFVRSRSIFLLSETLSDFRSRGVELSLVALYEIKPVLISCLSMQETNESDIGILGRIVSFVAYNVIMLDEDGWDELSDCIFSLADTEPLKALHFFIHLPSVYPSFIKRLMQRIFEKAEKVLLNPDEDRLNDWTLGLVAVVKLGYHLLDTEFRFDLLRNLILVLEKSASELTKKGMGEFLVQGLEGLERYVAHDMVLWTYNDAQCRFVGAVALRVEEVASHTKLVTRKITRLVKPGINPGIKLSELSPTQPQEEIKNRGAVSPTQPQEEIKNRGAESERDLKTLSPMEVLKIFASTEVEEVFRERAIRWLKVLLDDHISEKARIEISVMTQLQPLLITCLWSKGISDSMFVVLAEVVSHVAYEMFCIQSCTWFGLGDYIAKKSETEFERAVYIFQSLTMPLKDKEFVLSVTKNLLPEIITKLNPPREVLIGNSGWVLSFTGGFCAAIHLVNITSHAGYVNEVAYKMISSVTELVEREMEVGFVRRAFRDVESIVRKQVEWYGKSEYKFIKALLQSLYAIKGMKWESKIVLWRINVIVERSGHGEELATRR